MEPAAGGTHEGLGGTLATIVISDEPALKRVLDVPEHVAVCAFILPGYPGRRLTKLRREPVDTFTHLGRWGGGPLRAMAELDSPVRPK